MNMRKYLSTIGVILILGSVCLAQERLVENTTAEQFGKQLLGDWIKCAPDHSPRGETNGVFLIQRISFRTNDVVMWQETATNKTGRYRLEFERPPEDWKITFARITVTTIEGDSNTLTRVNFGPDNRFPPGPGTYLRIEGPSVYQVFKREDKRDSQPTNAPYSSPAPRVEKR